MTVFRLAARRHRARLFALGPVCLGLAACGAPQLYTGNLTKLVYTEPQRAATIQVSDVKLFQRHALLNERRKELSYLDVLLTNSETIAFGSDLARDLESITSMAVALGLSFDAGLKQNARFANETNGLNQELALESLRGKLAQMQRDVELLKAKLAEQTAPSAALATAPAASTNPAAPAPADAKSVITQLEGLVSKLATQLDRTVTGPRPSSVGGSPLDIFQDRQAYRRVLQAQIDATSLDALHDIGPNSLFRLQLQAMALPGEADKELGILEMTVKRPAFPRKDLDKELQALYFQWLDHATTNLNVLGDDGVVRADPGLLQLGLEERVMSIVIMNTGKQIVANSVTAPTNAQAQTPGKKPPAPTPNILVPGFDPTPYSTQIKKIMGTNLFDFSSEALLMSNRKSNLDLLAAATPAPQAGAGNPPAEASAPCTFGPVPAGASEQLKNCQSLRIAYPPSFNTAAIIGLQERIRKVPAKALQTLIDTLRSADKAGPRPSGSEQCLAWSGEFNQFRWMIDESKALRRLQRTYSWAYLKSGGSDPAAGTQVAQLTAEIGTALDRAEQAARLVQHLGCAPAADQPGLQAGVVPPEFIETLFLPPAATASGDGKDGLWTARGRLSTYAVTPSALVQRVSTAARAADAVQIAASLAAALPVQGIGASAGIGHMRSVTGKIDALERIPLVVGFSSAAQFDGAGIGRHETNPTRFGWLLGPKVVVDADQKTLALEHHLSPYDLTADVSMPGWWPQITLVSRSAWAPNWRRDRNLLLTAKESTERENVVPLRHTPADLDGLTQLLLNGTQNDGEGGGVGLKMPVASVTRIQPSTIADCVTQATFVVKGSNLWRASSAYLNGIEATGLSIMPDMGGAIMTFNIAGLQAGSGEATLVIPTPDGEATGKIHIQGNRNQAASCAAAPAEDNNPAIASVVPDTLYACDVDARLMVRGANLQDFKSAYLGNLPLKLVDASADGKVMQFQLSSPVGNRGGTQARLPLVITLGGGVAAGTVGIERGACQGGETSGSGGLTLVSGALDACVANATVQLAGAAAKKLVGARLLSTAPKFDLRAKSVKYNASAKVAELEFVGLPKSAITGPDALSSPFKLLLSSSKNEDIAVEVPAVCSVYGAK